MEMPWCITCLQELFRETDTLDCGVNYVFFNAPNMLGALRAPDIALANTVQWTGRELNTYASRSIAKERVACAEHVRHWPSIHGRNPIDVEGSVQPC